MKCQFGKIIVGKIQSYLVKYTKILNIMVKYLIHQKDFFKKCFPIFYSILWNIKGEKDENIYFQEWMVEVFENFLKVVI